VWVKCSWLSCPAGKQEGSLPAALGRRHINAVIQYYNLPDVDSLTVRSVPAGPGQRGHQQSPWKWLGRESRDSKSLFVMIYGILADLIASVCAAGDKLSDGYFAKLFD
jgi:hypothetical protein